VQIAVLPATTPESATDFFGFGVSVAGAADSDIGFLVVGSVSGGVYERSR
jgi:hypothetical protein